MDSHKNTIFDSKVLSATLRAVAQSSSNEEKVGEGFSAHVRRHEIDNKAYAVKFLQWSDKGSDRIIKEFEREVDVFEAIHNSNSNLKDYIIGYYGSYRENNQAIIILELADTDALKILQCQSQPFSVEFSNPTNKTECTLSSHGENNNPNHFWMKILLDISKSFQLLHSLGYYHRDFHLMNCLFLLGDTKHSVKTKLGDFGGSLHQKDAPITWIGHSRFSAPEVLSQKKAKQPASNYSFASDVFMFGMAMYEILHGYQGDQRIWVEHGNFEMSSLIIKGERPPITQNNCNPDYVKLMQECWSQNPSQRPSFEVIYKRLSDMMNAKQRVQIKKDDKVKGHERIHTYHLYLRDEVMSVLQKSVRRGLVEDALYWASELDQSGQGKSAIDRLTVVASEDASLSVPHMPIYVNQLHKEYYTYIGGHNKEKSRKALFRLAEVLCQINKCRSANNACGYTLAIMEERIEKAMNNPNSNDYELLNTPDHSFLKILQKYMEESRTKFEQEEKALFLLQRLYMELDDKGFHIWEKDLWDLVCSLTTKHEITKQTIEALRELTLPRHIGGESGCRLRLFHAVVLYTRELYLDFTIEIPPTQIEYEKTYEKLYNKPGLEGRHPEGIPFYAVDRHNRRGKGGKADTYFMHGDDTSNYITTGATEWKLDISNWPIEEIAKSHGPGRRFFKNHNTGKPTLITQFFYEGSNVYKEYLPPIAKDKSGNVIDPYRQKAADYYEFIEELHGSNNSKSACITPHHRSLIQKLQERRGFSSIDVKNLAIEDENKNATDEKPVKKERKNRVQGSWSGKQ